jgi:thioredoxin-like negative regulator of GroEL
MYNMYINGAMMMIFCRFNVIDFPTLVLVKAGAPANEFETYKGVMKFEPIVAWLSQFAAEKPVGPSGTCV